MCREAGEAGEAEVRIVVVVVRPSCGLSAGPCRVTHLDVTSCRLAFSCLALNRMQSVRVFAPEPVPNVSPTASLTTVLTA